MTLAANPNMVTCWIWQGGCQINWGTVADWAQVISAGLGLFFAWRLGNKQSKEQFDNAMKQVAAQHENSLKLIQHQSNQIIKNSLETFNLKVIHIANLCAWILGKQTWMKAFNLAEINCQNFIHNELITFENELAAIPFYKVPNTLLVNEIAIVKSTLRQLRENIDFAIQQQKKLRDYDKNTLDKVVKEQLDTLQEAIENLKKEIKKYS